MATLELPLEQNGYPDYTFSIVLDTAKYKFGIKWNERESRWYLSLFDIDDNLILDGVPMVVDWNLLRRNRISGRPPGELYAIDTEEGGEANLTELGNRVVLVYEEEA